MKGGGGSDRSHNIPETLPKNCTSATARNNLVFCSFIALPSTTDSFVLTVAVLIADVRHINTALCSQNMIFFDWARL